MKYVLLAYSGENFASLSEGERNAMFDRCFEYDAQLRISGHFAAEAPLESPDKALTLYWKNGKVATTDGPFVETKEQLGGIGIIEARDLNHAVQLMAQHPALEYGTVFELRPTADMNAMIEASQQRRRQNTAS